MSALIKRELLILKNNFILFLSSIVLLPMFIYLFISIPLSFYINFSNGINYLNWSSVGNWISSSLMVTYIVSIRMSSQYRMESSLSKTSLVAPVSNNEHVMAIIFCSGILGFLQLLFSIFITLSLNNSNLFISDLLLAILYIIPVIIMVSNLGLAIGISSSDILLKKMISIFLFIVLFFSSGLFFPLDNALPSMFLFSPFHLSSIQIQSIITNDASMIHSSVIMLLISFVLYIVNLIVSSRVFRL